MELEKLFADVIGYDLASIYLEDNISIHGYLLESPLEERMVRMFKYEPVEVNANKPYQAHWMITDNKLCLLYVNARLNGEFLFTDDIVPEYEDDEETCLHHFNTMTGELIFFVEEIQMNTIKLPFGIGDKIKLDLVEGILKSIDEMAISRLL